MGDLSSPIMSPQLAMKKYSFVRKEEKFVYNTTNNGECRQQ